jgi:serine/threonine protein kinase
MQLYQKRESIEFQEDAGGGSIIATVCRGPSKARFAINKAIMKFVEQFSSPCTTDDAIARYCENENIQLTDQSLQKMRMFARQITATLLLSPIERNVESAAQSIEKLGFTHIKTFKDKRFDTVSLVNDGSRELVVKNIKETLVSQQARKRILDDLKNEFTALSRLKFVEGVVKPLELSVQAPAFFAMGMVDGERLDKFIKVSPMTLDQRLSLAGQLLYLLHSIHEAGVLHGDIHLGNFMCSLDHHITIIDFGCAVVDGEVYRPSSGATPHFTPPERASSSWTQVCHSGATKAGECYQMGVIIAYVLTGTLPFRGKTYRELHKTIVAGKHTLPNTTPDNESIPNDILALVIQMMSKEPELRPADLLRTSNTFHQLNKKESFYAI